jgi:RNA polymerase sigma-32 factor
MSIYSEVSKLKILPNNEVVALIAEYQQNQSSKTREKIINSTLRLVLKIANEYRFSNDSQKMQDLFQEGTLGLIRAIDKYNVNLGVPWAHYAALWIRAYMRRSAYQNMVKRGTTKAERKYFVKLKKEIARLETLGIPYTMQSLADKFYLTPDKVEMILTRSNKDLYFSDTNSSSEDPDDNSFEDYLADSNSIGIEDSIVNELDTNSIKLKYSKFIESLPAQRKLIFEKRFLLETPETLEQIGKQLGVTRARVQQIQAEISKDFKNALETDSV